MHILEAFLHVKMNIKLFYNIKNLYSLICCKKHYITVFMYKKSVY